MKIIRIFGDNLFSIKYAGEEKDEFSRLFELWQNPEYLETFFEKHKSDLENGFWGSLSIEKAMYKTFLQASEFERIFLGVSKEKPLGQIKSLEEVFSPLHNSQYYNLTLLKSKARRRWLRLYGLRVENDIYLITGGTIKLTRRMQEREHTKNELVKIEKCRRYLIDHGIVDLEGIIEEIEC